MCMKNLKFLLVLLSAFCCAKASADLVWSADKGWRVEGGVLANVIGESSTVSNAIDAMNKARSAQEQRSFRSALEYYAVVIADYPESIFAPEALFQSAKIYLERGQFPEAYESVEQIIKQSAEIDRLFNKLSFKGLLCEVCTVVTLLFFEFLVEYCGRCLHIGRNPQGTESAGKYAEEQPADKAEVE